MKIDVGWFYWLIRLALDDKGEVKEYDIRRLEDY
jgi:hypothetical protein